MPRRSWIQIEFSLPQPYQDLLTGQLAGLGVTGFIQEESRLKGYIPSRLWTERRQIRLRRVLSAFHSEFPVLMPRYRTSVIRDANWNTRWERSIGIVDATPRIVVKPSWKHRRKKDRGKIVLHIDPQMSFGTGHHETTRLSLHLLEHYVPANGRVLDAGTGTGILAIAAVKLGARRAVGIDADPWSVRNARANVRKNNVSGRVSIHPGDLSRLPRRRYDLVVANIDLPTILSSIQVMKSRLARGGILILSGLLNSDLSTLLDALGTHRLDPIELISENEWAAIALTHSHASRST